MSLEALACRSVRRRLELGAAVGARFRGGIARAATPQCSSGLRSAEADITSKTSAQTDQNVLTRMHLASKQLMTETCYKSMFGKSRKNQYSSSSFKKHSTYS